MVHNWRVTDADSSHPASLRERKRDSLGSVDEALVLLEVGLPLS